MGSLVKVIFSYAASSNNSALTRSISCGLLGSGLPLTLVQVIFPVRTSSLNWYDTWRLFTKLLLSGLNSVNSGSKLSIRIIPLATTLFWLIRFAALSYAVGVTIRFPSTESINVKL